MKSLKHFFYLLIFLLLLSPVSVGAQGIVTCGPEQSAEDPSRKLCELKDLFGLLVSIYNFLLGMAGIVAFGLLVWGGIQMILSSVDESKLQSGKETVTQAIIGLVIILLAYIIVNTLLLALGVTDGATSFFSGAKFFGN